MRLYDFPSMIGNAATLSLLMKSLEKNKLPNFVLYIGPVGTGKSTAAETAALRLTCMTPNGPNPCLQCESCKLNLEALRTTGRSLNLVKVNLAMVDSNKDLSEVIREIFHLRGVVGNNVYIIEQMEVLNDNQQSKFLEEIDRLSSNSYVFACTNKPQRLMRDIHSRAIPMKFKLLNENEAKLLFDRTVVKLGIKKVSKETEKLVIRHGRGTARDIVNMIKFIADVNPTEDELIGFLEKIGNDVFIGLFHSTKESTLSMANAIDRVLKQYPLDTLLTGMKEFLFNVVFCFEGGITEEFNKADREFLSTIFNEKSLSQVISIVEKLNIYNCTEVDLKLLMFRVRQAMVGGKLEHVLTDNRRAASAQSITATETYAREQEFRQQVASGKGGDDKLTLSKLDQFVE